ncbi:hypothetical protein [Pseudomonas sp.]|uniref:hypothetical protein n=1 Tax=Pseudomonas sp. TaxID=306 RepID=UPI0028A0DD57|nr:hypothetical protein [Pseudomonas sp.]
MPYYGASNTELVEISKILNLPVSEMGQDWEFTLSSPEIIHPAIEFIAKKDSDLNIRAAVSCLLISSLYEYHRDMNVDHPLYKCALDALHKDNRLIKEIIPFWETSNEKYIKDILLRT